MIDRILASIREAATRKATAGGLWVIALALVLAAIAFFVGVFRHWLIPKLGVIGADAVIGAVFLVLAAMVMIAAAAYGRPPVRREPPSPIAGLMEVARQGTALRFGAELAERLGPAQRIGLGLLAGYIIARSTIRAPEP